MIYNLTEKFLLLFPFYRERVSVMDSYALRLSEAVEALHTEIECHSDTTAKWTQARTDWVRAGADLALTSQALERERAITKTLLENFALEGRLSSMEQRRKSEEREYERLRQKNNSLRPHAKF